MRCRARSATGSPRSWRPAGLHARGRGYLYQEETLSALADVLGEGGVEGGFFLGIGIGLMAPLPLVIRHSIIGVACRILGHLDAALMRGLLIPATEAVAAEPGEVHQVDILHVGALVHQVMAQLAECGGLELGAGLVVHDLSPFWPKMGRAGAPCKSRQTPTFAATSCRMGASRAAQPACCACVAIRSLRSSIRTLGRS